MSTKAAPGKLKKKGLGPIKSPMHCKDSPAFILKCGAGPGWPGLVALLSFEMWGGSLAGLGWWPCFHLEMWGWSLAGLGWWLCFHFEMWAGPWAGGSDSRFRQIWC